MGVEHWGHSETSYEQSERFARSAVSKMRRLLPICQSAGTAAGHDLQKPGTRRSIMPVESVDVLHVISWERS